MGDITRIQVNVLNLANSETIDSLTDAEFGQWMRLFNKSVLLAKDCTLPVDEKTLAGYTKSGKLSPRVLACFPIVMTEAHGPRRRNDILYAAWLEVKTSSDRARLVRQQGVKRPVEPNPEESVNHPVDRLTIDRQSSDVVGHNTIEYNTEQNSNNREQSAGDILSAMSTETVDEKDLGGLKPGEPGFFKKFQYPGTDPKVVFKYVAAVWARVHGDAAFARYPSKYPESWKLLCDQKGGDLIVPAFELWCEKHGSKLNPLTCQYPTADFLKVAQEFMAKVLPLNKRKLDWTPEQDAATVAQARAAHEAKWAVPVTVEPDGDGSELFEEKS